MLSLVAIPVILALSAALQFSDGRLARFDNWIFAGGVAGALLFVVIGLPATVAGNEAQLNFADPVPGVAIGFTATASGYSILGLSLCAAAVLMVQVTARDRRVLQLGLVGVAVSCLGGNIFMLGFGAEIVVLSALLATKNDEPLHIRHWLEAGVLQVAAACLIGAACWYQIQASTTSFNVLPASAANVASLTWGLGIALLLVAGAMTASSKSRGLTYSVVALGSLIVINAVRIDQVTAALSPVSVTPFVAAGCVAGVFALLRIWRASTLQACAHWFWVGTFVPLLFVTAVQDPSGYVLGAQTFAVFVSGVLLALVATRTTLGVSKSLALLAVIGLPLGPVLPGWILGVAVTATTPSARALSWVLIAFGVLFVVAGLRIARRSWEPGIPLVPRNIVLIVMGVICAIASLIPGLLTSTIFTWIVDGSATSSTAYSLPLATGNVWPGGLVAAICLAIVVVAFSSATILGVPGRGSGRTVAEESEEPEPWQPWRHVEKLFTSLGRAVKNIDDWLLVEPRLATVVLAGAVALAVFR
jgi:hypothetical protein